MSPRNEQQFEQMREEASQKIKQSALALFARQGFRDTSVASIAEEAGVSKGLIYNYFESKEHLLTVIFEDISKLKGDYYALLSGMTSKEKLEFTLRETIKNLDTSREFTRTTMRFGLELNEMPQAQQFIQIELTKGMELFEKIFIDLGYEDPKQEAWLLTTVMHGMSSLSLMLDSKFERYNVIQFLKNRYKLKKL